MMLAMANAKVSRLRGKPETFTPAQNEAIRSALRGYVQRNKLTGEQLGKRLGEFGQRVSQQTASGYLNGTGGFSYPAASAIAWMLSYDGVDELLREHRVYGGPAPAADSSNPERDLAERWARRMGVGDTAIARVNERYADAHHIARWWSDMYSHEQSAIDEERLRAAEERRAKGERKRG